MATSHEAYRVEQRRKRIERTLPEPLGEAAIAATSYVRREMTDVSLRLALVQAALRMSIDGKTRATATEVTDWAREEAGNWILPSVAGQVFSALGVRRVSVHGQRRLVLEFDQLKLLHEELVERFEEIKPRAEEASKSFDQLMEQVQGLEERVQLIHTRADREKYLRDFIVKYEQNLRRFADLERRYQLFEAQAKRCEQLESEMEGLSQRVKDLPILEGRRQELQARLDKHGAAEIEIKEREQALGREVYHLRHRQALVNIQELEERSETKRRELEEEVRDRRNQLDQEVGERKQQLDQETRERRKTLKYLDKQINSRRSLLDRVLRKEKDEEAS